MSLLDREIKFRVWIKVSQRIASWEMIEERKNLYRLIKDSEYLLMQYIGLKDKNGVEIYEGDIVKDSSSRIMVIEWDDRIGTSRFILKTINEVSHIKAGRYLDLNQWITSIENDLEVIGNIYENQELLKA